MNTDKVGEMILRARMHGLYLSRGCGSIVELSRELIGMHCWFHRNVAFSALIRGAALPGWKSALTKTWIHHALHGVAYDDLPTLLAVNAGGGFRWGEPYAAIAERTLSLMEDGVCSRAELRRIFAADYDRRIVEHAFSPWGGVFGELARLGKVAFRDMASRDFDLIDAEPHRTRAEVLPGLFRRFIASYGPATISDAAWFFGLMKERKKELTALDLGEYERLEHNRQTHYHLGMDEGMGEIPEVTLLSGFDPYIVTYVDRGAMLPKEFKAAVIMKSGICLPTVALNGVVAGLWNIKKGAPFLEFFSTQPKKIVDKARGMVESVCAQMKVHG
ncbi:MAG: winged helix DNA-binding domain-containing protein [Oscillospiraceae bacterium]|nr:winged helix DNA-binding domain-containing protein [Oscillospiraceae bacterium]